MQDGLSLSLVIPVFNEQESISLFLERARPAVARALELIGAEARAEFLFVDDGSSDRTRDILTVLSRLNEDVRFIALSRNFGKEAALAAGMTHAVGDAVIPIDVDLQDPPELVVDMVREWQAGAKVVNARRIDRSTDTRFKRWSAHLFYKLINRLSDHPIPENVGDFRLLDREAVDVVKTLREQSRFNKGLFSWIGFKVSTVDYEREARGAGETKWRVRKLWNLALDAITSSTTAPLRIWTYVGAGIALLAFGYAALLVGLALVGDIETPGYASMMVAILMLGGLNLLSLGIMGEYLGRIAREVRARPLYVVQTEAAEPVVDLPEIIDGDTRWTDLPMRA